MLGDAVATLAQGHKNKHEQKGHSFDLGSHADSCLHTLVTVCVPCSCIVKSENFTIGSPVKVVNLH